MYNSTKMKKVINESTIRDIVRESLKNYIKESMEDDSSDFEGWTPEDVDDDMEEMFLAYGNNNIYSDGTPGMASMLSQGDDSSYATKLARSLRSCESDTNDAFYDEIKNGYSFSNTPEDDEFIKSHYGTNILDVVNESVTKALNKFRNSKLN